MSTTLLPHSVLIRTSTLLLLLSSLLLDAVAQIPMHHTDPQWTSSGNEVYAVPGSHLLQKDWERIGPLLNAAAGRASNGLLALQNTVAWGFTVGDTRDWWATNLTTYKEYAVSSTCRAVGTHCYIFVENAVWESRVTQAVVDSLRFAFDSRTPANSAKGIYELDGDYFGTPPDVDSDPKIVILVLDIVDGFSGSGGYVAGYFYSINEYSEALVQAQLGHDRHSNEAEIYYIDANPANLTSPSGFAAGASTTAHEFQHMIHFNHDQNEITFVNEGMSETASVLCGYSIRSASLYYANTNVDFLSWNATGNVLADYSRTAMFSWYIVEQYGSSVTKDIVARSENSVAGYDAAFTLHGSSRMFTGILTDFGVATVLNDAVYNPRFGFVKSIMGGPTPQTSHSTNIVSATTDSIKPYGTRYIRFTEAAPLCFIGTSTGMLSVRAILTGPGISRVDTITLGTPYYTSLASTYDTVFIAVTNLSSSGQAFSYTASQDVLPVQLTSFVASLNAPDIRLNWISSTEVDNLGFAVERRMLTPQQTQWEEVAFRTGAGSSSQPIEYSYSDRPGIAGRYAYRLRQVDHSGLFSYSAEVEIELSVPTGVSISQNYPNPFNPLTTIEYRLSIGGLVRLSVFDLLGREVAVLVNEEKSAGWHVVQFDATGLSSGAYLCRIQVGETGSGLGAEEVKRCILLR